MVVFSKKTKVYIWLAIDRTTREIIGCYLGDRSRKSANRAVGKETGQTNPIERLNNTLRQRISRLVRQSLSFSKKMDNHIEAIWYFIHDYNAQSARH